MEGKSAREIESARKRVENETAGPWRKIEIISPPMINLETHRISMKYGKFSSSSQRMRLFFFDVNSQKYRYLKENKEVQDKAMNLNKCEYEITTKEEPGSLKWDDNTGQALYRLIMKFDQREKRPIFVYERNLDRKSVV